MTEYDAMPVAVERRSFIQDGWPRTALRLHLALTPSSMGTAFMLVRFANVSRGLSGRHRARVRKNWLRRRNAKWSSVFRLAFQDVLERRRWAIPLGAIGFFGLLGGLIGRAARMLMEVLA